MLPSFNETRAPTSRRYVAEQGTVIANWLKIYQIFRLDSSVCPLEKEAKNLNFEFLLPPIELLVATFNETCTPISRKYVAEQGIVMPNW